MFCSGGTVDFEAVAPFACIGADIADIADMESTIPTPLGAASTDIYASRSDLSAAAAPAAILTPVEAASASDEALCFTSLASFSLL